MKFIRVRIGMLRQLARAHLLDGSRFRPESFGGKTVEQSDRLLSSPTHTEQKRLGICFFAQSGYRVFPFQIGIKLVDAWADFAVAKSNRVILVECLTDVAGVQIEDSIALGVLNRENPVTGRSEKIVSDGLEGLRRKISNKRTLELKGSYELWFVVGDGGRRVLKEELGYHAMRLEQPQPTEASGRFWICRPAATSTA